MIIAPLDHLQYLFKAKGRVDALHLFLNDPPEPKKVIASAKAVLPPELVLQVPSSRNGLAEETLLMVEVSLDIASALSFTTAVFIALSVFFMNVGERRRQLSILRAIGATKRQILSIVGREAVLLGIVGTILGIPIGFYAGHFVLAAMAAVLQVNLPHTPDLRWAMAAGAIVGPAICILGAWFPARRASKVSPLEGMRPIVTMQPTRGHKAMTITGLCGFALSVLVAMFAIYGDAPIWAAVVALVTCLVSLVFLLPIALSPAVAVIAAPLRRLLGVEGEMSRAAWCCGTRAAAR